MVPSQISSASTSVGSLAQADKQHRPPPQLHVRLPREQPLLRAPHPEFSLQVPHAALRTRRLRPAHPADLRNPPPCRVCHSHPQAEETQGQRLPASGRSQPKPRAYSSTGATTPSAACALSSARSRPSKRPSGSPKSPPNLPPAGVSSSTSPTSAMRLDSACIASFLPEQDVRSPDKLAGSTPSSGIYLFLPSGFPEDVKVQAAAGYPVTKAY